MSSSYHLPIIKLPECPFSTIYPYLLIGLSVLVFTCQPQEPIVKSDFPTLTGPYPIGTDTISFFRPLAKTDSTAGTNRYLNTQIWYPRKPNAALPYTNYILDTVLIEAFKKQEYFNLSNPVLDQWKTLQVSAALGAEILPSKEKYPLIIFSHGFGMSKSNYSSFLF